MWWKNEIGKLIINNYYQLKNGQTVKTFNLYQRNNDTPLIILNQAVFYRSVNTSFGSQLFACSPNFYNPSYSNIEIKTLTNFNVNKLANSLINEYIETIYKDTLTNNYKTSPLNLPNYNSEKYSIALIKQPEVDSVKLEIKVFYNNNVTRAITTDWLYFK